MNNTRFKDGRLGIGRTPIFPLDVSGNTRIEGDLVLKGTIADGSGVPIYFGHAGVTSTDGSNNIYHIGINRAVATDANFPLDVSGNINIDNGSLYINGEIAEFSNWTDIGETEESGIYRNSKVAIGKTTANHTLDVSGTVNIDGDILLNGTSMEPNPSVPALQAYTDTGPTWKDATIITTVSSSSSAELSNQTLTNSINAKADKASPEFSGNVGIGKAGNASYALDILGDVNITSGALKLDGSTPVYSNWTVSNSDIFRNSKVTIGSTTVQNYQLYVNGNTHVNGTLSATTLDGNLEWSKIQNQPTTIATSQTNAIVANTAKVSSQWITNSNDIHYNTGNVGIGTDSPQSQLQIGDFTGTPHLTLAGKNNSATSSGIYFTDNDAGENPINYGMGIQFDSLNNILNIIGDDNGDGTTDKLMTIMRANGKVGIGTTSPNSKLEIHGGTLGLKNGNHTATTAQQILFGFSGVTNLEYAHSIRTRHNGQSSANDTQNSIDFYLWKKGDTTTTIGEKHGMSITAAGVGIGTTSPGARLEVNGLAKISSSVAIGHTNSPITRLDIRENGGPRLRLENTSGTYSGQNGAIEFCTTYATTGFIHQKGEDLRIGVTGSSSEIHFYTNNNSGFPAQDGNTQTQSFFNETYTSGNDNPRMIINGSGNVGIGTTSPYYKLEVKGGHIGATYDSDHNYGVYMDMDNTSYARIQTIRQGVGYNYDLALQPNGGNVGIGTTTMTTTFNVSGSFYLSGYQSIGTTSILYPLWVASRSANPAQGGSKGAGRYFTDGGDLRSLSNWGVEYSNGYGGGGVATADAGKTSIRADGIIWSDIAVAVSSDSRIKKNIVDVPDQQALEMVRNIPCRYYEYIDNTFIKREGKTIGFIAQEVKDILPMAVNQETRFIPDVMKMLSVDNENIIDWTEDVDNSNNKIFKMKYDELGNVNNIEYKFYVADVSNNSSLEKIIIGNEDNTFTFEQKWNYVFCYGRKVDDFHTLDKQKLFALNFSATQELDKKIIALEAENAELKAKLQSIEQRLAFAGF